MEDCDNVNKTCDEEEKGYDRESPNLEAIQVVEDPQQTHKLPRRSALKSRVSRVDSCPISCAHTTTNTHLSPAKNSIAPCTCKNTPRRKRSVSFHSTLSEENVDLREPDENSDNYGEDDKQQFDLEEMEIDDEINIAMGRDAVRFPCERLRRSISFDSLNFRPPTPPNVSHLVRPTKDKNKRLSFEDKYSKSII